MTAPMPLDEASVMPGFIAQCGACKGNLWIRDAALARDVVCEQCASLGQPGSMLDVTDALVANELGWCGCGGAWMIDSAMLDYLRALDRPATSPKLPDSYHPVAWAMLASIADARSWTWHGTSLEVAWLTDVGRQVIERLAAVVDNGPTSPAVATE